VIAKGRASGRGDVVGHVMASARLGRAQADGSVPAAMGAVHHPPITEVRRVVAAALAEDLAPLGDLSAGLLPPGATATALLVPRADGILAGTACVTETFAQLDPTVSLEWDADDGDRAAAGVIVGTVRGPLASILTGERTALNFLNHLSGVASLTRRFVDAAAAGGSAKVWDTRKTTPGLRSLEKAAVRAGGGWNHRGNLSEWVMFKDNHLTELAMEDAVRAARAQWPARTIQVEADSLEKVAAALAAGADAILLDNLGVDGVRDAVALADAHGPDRPLLEASGQITLDSIGAYADTGVDVISTSQITISAPVLDIGLDIEP
jgi:nicotinate-nucleotide pyrophosphorylase (carboxylating)